VFFGLLALVVGIYFWWQHSRGTPDHFVRINGTTADEVWVFDIRELWVELRQGPHAVDAKLRYELRREAPAHWEMRLTSTHPAPRNLVFPSASLRALQSEYDETTLDQPWTRCGPPVDEQLEHAHRRYNRLYHTT
jgi:hypothetical protein